jgi:hypothetical protein
VLLYIEGAQIKILTEYKLKERNGTNKDIKSTHFKKETAQIKILTVYNDKERNGTNKDKHE